MAFEITVTAEFCATHQLRLPEGSREGLHEHRWRVRATYRGEELNAMGVLVDFSAARAALERVAGDLHEGCLNEHPAFAIRNPSAENVARHIAGQMRADGPAGELLSCVEVEEEPGCFARCYLGDRRRRPAPSAG